MMSKILTGMVLAGVMISASAASAATVTNKQKVVSHLFGSASVDAKASYQKCLMDGVACKQFSMVVDGAQPNAAQTIYVNGNSVAVLHTDSSDHGKVKYRTAAFIGDSHAASLAAAFPKIERGDVVTMGHMAGVFFDAMDDDEQEFEVEGDFAGPVGTSGDVSYNEESEDGVIDREFELEFAGAQPNEVLNITVNGVVVYTVTADANGEVHLTLKSADGDDDDDQNCDDDDQGENDQGSGCNGGDDDDDGGTSAVIPDTFPSIAAGDVIGIDGATATMAASSGDDDDDDHDGTTGEDDDDQGEDD